MAKSRKKIPSLLAFRQAQAKLRAGIGKLKIEQKRAGSSSAATPRRRTKKKAKKRSTKRKAKRSTKRSGTKRRAKRSGGKKRSRRAGVIVVHSGPSLREELGWPAAARVLRAGPSVRALPARRTGSLPGISSGFRLLPPGGGKKRRKSSRKKR